MEKKLNLVVLFSNWYSGATLFTILVNNHSQVVSNGETFPFSSDDKAKYICSCGSYTDECEFYRYAAGHMRTADGRDWDRNLFVQTPRLSGISIVNRYLNSARFEGRVRSQVIGLNRAWRTKQEDFMHAQREFFLRALDFNNASVYMDGMKSIRRAEFFVKDDEINMKVINLVRDGRAFCYSYVRNEGRSIEDLDEAAIYWNNYLHLSDAFRERCPDVQFIDIRYEDICKDQQGSLGKVFDFMGLEYEPLDINNKSRMHILGHAMRKSFSGEIREHAEWKTELGDRAVRHITSRMSSYLSKYGYI